MYAAKSRQCGSLIYHAQLDAGSQESLSLLSELRRAVENEELRLYLQPKVDLQQGKVVGAEALVRWQHPTRGLVPPMQFIPFAEQTGFIRMADRPRKTSAPLMTSRSERASVFCAYSALSGSISSVRPS